MAGRGNATAIAALVGPPFPVALTGLWDRFQVLDMARGEGQFGPAAITHVHLEAANRLHDWQLAPHEVQALLALDLAIRFPD